MKLPAYPRYKPSGVEWLGDVPVHWEVKRLKMTARLTDKKVEADEDNPVPYIGMENIESWTGRLLPINPDVVPTGSANAFKASHTLFGKLRPYLAKACNPEFDGLCSTELLVLKGVEFDRKALLFALLSDGFIKLVDSSTYGSKMPRASWDFIGNCVLPVAPPAEQQAIAAFLDRETGRVDRLVAKKRELIERLQEKRTALISCTVTRGLPPAAARAAGFPENPPLKPSGLDWLGDIPKHWEVKQLKWAVMFQRGHDLPTDEREEGEVPLVTSAGVSATHSRAAAKGPGIVTGRYGTIGEFYFVDCDYWPLNTTLYSINLRGNDPRFLVYLLRHLSPLFLLNAVKSAVPGVDRNDIHPTMTVVPPLPEQAAIAAYLDLETAKLDALVGKVEEAVERLQEYRTALITAAVTGKIDVRNTAKLV
jgi:type I restriction enzyme S subunit